MKTQTQTVRNGRHSNSAKSKKPQAHKSAPLTGEGMITGWLAGWGFGFIRIEPKVAEALGIPAGKELSFGLLDIVEPAEVDPFRLNSGDWVSFKLGPRKPGEGETWNAVDVRVLEPLNDGLPKETDHINVTLGTLGGIRVGGFTLSDPERYRVWEAAAARNVSPGEFVKQAITALTNKTLGEKVLGGESDGARIESPESGTVCTDETGHLIVCGNNLCEDELWASRDGRLFIHENADLSRERQVSFAEAREWFLKYHAGEQLMPPFFPEGTDAYQLSGLVYDLQPAAAAGGKVSVDLVARNSAADAITNAVHKNAALIQLMQQGLTNPGEQWSNSEEVQNGLFLLCLETQRALESAVVTMEEGWKVAADRLAAANGEATQQHQAA